MLVKVARFEFPRLGSFALTSALVGILTFCWPEVAWSKCSLAFTNVSVVTMRDDTILQNQTVLVDGALISSLGSALQIGAAGCTKVIDGRGKFLSPGLVDAHVHVESVAFSRAFGREPTSIDFRNVLALYPAFGVTSIRVMSGAPDILRFRDAPSDGKYPLPRLIVASPMLSGVPPVLPPPITQIVETPDEARASVRQLASDGYDLIKIRDNLKADVFRAVVEEALRQHIDVDGHISHSMGMELPDLLNAGQRGFAHLDEVTRSLQAQNGARKDEIIRLLKDKDAYVSSTMVVLKSAIDQIVDYEGTLRRPNMRFLHPLLTTTFWTRGQNPYLKPNVDVGFFRRLLDETKRTLKLLNDRGIQILAGTDAMNPMILPGEGMHEELRLMVDAGLTPFQALKTATANPAQVLRGLANSGTIAVGRSADLILLAANPLDDIGALSRPEFVVIRGHWFDRAALDDRLAEIAVKLKQ